MTTRNESVKADIVERQDVAGPQNVAEPQDVAGSYDVVVAGGGAAGLSAGLTLARARRTVLVVDAGEPRNAPADRVHNYLGREGTPPAELLAVGRDEVTSYGGRVVRGRIVSARPLGGEGGDHPAFAVSLADGSVVEARRLLLATGLTDGLPEVEGLASRWGRDVLHCPYCHGWEVRDRTIGVLATGPHAVEQALLFRQWSERVVLFLHTAPDPDDERWERLAARGVTVVDGEVAAVEVEDDRLTGLRLRSGRAVPCDAVAVGPVFTARDDLPAALGLEVPDRAMGEHVIGRSVAAGPGGATAVPGVWAAGNATDLSAGVIQAAAGGFTAAVAINADLVAEDTARAVAARRERSARAAGGAGRGDEAGRVEENGPHDGTRDGTRDGQAASGARGAGPRGAFSARMETEVSKRVLGGRRHGV